MVGLFLSAIISPWTVIVQSYWPADIVSIEPSLIFIGHLVLTFIESLAFLTELFIEGESTNQLYTVLTFLLFVLSIAALMLGYAGLCYVFASIALIIGTFNVAKMIQEGKPEHLGLGAATAVSAIAALIATWLVTTELYELSESNHSESAEEGH